MSLSSNVAALATRIAQEFKAVRAYVDSKAMNRHVIHGNDPNAARPVTTDPVFWYGTVDPVNADDTKDVTFFVNAETGQIEAGSGDHTHAVLDAATAANVIDTLVKRDGTGGFAAGNITANSFTATTPNRGLWVKTTSTTEHAATIYQAGATGSGVALNLISDNVDDSAVYVSGKHKVRGTVKIAHVGYADASDASASAISIDLQTAGTASKGIFITGTDGPTTGDLIDIRNNGRNDFVIKGTGRVGIGVPLATTPAGLVEIAQPDDTTPGLVVRGRTSGTNMAEFRRPSDGAIRTRISNNAQIISQETAYFAGPGVQVGATSLAVGGGSTGVIGITNATTVPTSNPTGGGVLYSEGGLLKWRGSAGDPVVLANAAPTVLRAVGGVYPTRPTWAVQAIWIGATDPGTAALDGDQWVQV